MIVDHCHGGNVVPLPQLIEIGVVESVFAQLQVRFTSYPFAVAIGVDPTMFVHVGAGPVTMIVTFALPVLVCPFTI
ncbi:MAG: hypothetical protein WCJ45_06915 [bacterium]